MGQLSQQGACYTNMDSDWIIVVNQDTSWWTQAGLWRSLAGQSVSELGFMRNPVCKQGGKQWRMWFLCHIKHMYLHIYTPVQTCHTHASTYNTRVNTQRTAVIIMKINGILQNFHMFLNGLLNWNLYLSPHQFILKRLENDPVLLWQRKVVFKVS